MSESLSGVEANPPTPRFAWKLSRDEHLAKRAAAGDERAFATLFERYHQELYRYSRAIVTNPEDAEDAIQATMVKALRALPGERREIAIRPWLYRVAHNESISIVRARRESVELDPAGLEAAATVEASAEMRERVRALVADLGTLPERQRATLVMRELNDLSYDEIGAALAIRPAAAKQSVYEARSALLEVAEGRDMDCRNAREAISAGDRRVLRGRKIRAHLRACEGCSHFEAAIDERRTTLAALAPPLAAPAALAILHGILSGGSTGAAGAGAGATVGAGIAGGAALKGAVAVLTVAAVGGGAAATGVFDRGADDRATNAQPAAGAERSKPSPAASNTATAPASPNAGGGSARADERSGQPQGRDGNNSADTGGGAGAGAGNSATAPGQTGEAPGQTVSEEGPTHSNAGGGGSATAPGQTGTAPGQAHSNAGGGGSTTAPGQTGTAPGHSGTAQGQSQTAPGQSAAEQPSPSGNAVGHATAPGQADK